MTRTCETSRGFTLIELLIALAMAGLILAATSGLVNNALGTDEVVAERNQLFRDARFAMDRMVNTASGSRHLLLPLADNPFTNWPENIREETVPASLPIGDSTEASAVFAVTLPADIDLDADGFPDADNDRDGRIDEDTPSDATWDLASGILLIDDDGDGLVDEGNSNSDDESTTINDDPINGIDDDVDGNVDEDPASDNNNDGCPGVCGVDDDEDGLIDEGNAADDDEDGNTDEDFYGAVVFYLDNGVIKERMPVPWDISGDSLVNGLDYIVSDIADSVTRFRVERIAAASGRPQLVSIELELTGPTGTVVSLEMRVRIGGAL